MQSELGIEPLQSFEAVDVAGCQNWLATLEGPTIEISTMYLHSQTVGACNSGNILTTLVFCLGYGRRPLLNPSKLVANIKNVGGLMSTIMRLSGSLTTDDIEEYASVVVPQVGEVVGEVGKVVADADL